MSVFTVANGFSARLVSLKKTLAPATGLSSGPVTVPVTVNEQVPVGLPGRSAAGCGARFSLAAGWGGGSDPVRPAVPIAMNPSTNPRAASGANLLVIGPPRTSAAAAADTTPVRTAASADNVNPA